MFEHHHEPLLPRTAYLRRVLRGLGAGLVIIAGSLGIGVIGYHYTETMPWLDALVSASMILFGEGPVQALQTSAGKWFASVYAMFSGVAFITIVGVIFVPVCHRFLHKFHLEVEDDGGAKRRKRR
jgi:hypothetical protein